LFGEIRGADFESETAVEFEFAAIGSTCAVPNDCPKAALVYDGAGTVFDDFEKAFFEVSGAKEDGIFFKKGNEFSDGSTLAFPGLFSEVVGPKFIERRFILVPRIASFAPSNVVFFFPGVTKLKGAVDLVVKAFFLGSVFCDFGSGERHDEGDG